MLPIEVFLQSCLLVVMFLICGTLRAALQLLTPKTFGVGVIPQLERALAFLQGLLGLSPFRGFGKLPLARLQDVLSCGCGFLINVLDIDVGVRVFGASSALFASADFGSFRWCDLVDNHAGFIEIIGVKADGHGDLDIARLC